MVFVVVEQKEPHAGRMAFEDVAQPGTFAERCSLARRLRDELEVPLPIFVDGMDDASRALFSDLPSPAFLIDRAGRIADKLPWADPAPLAAALRAVLANAPAAPPAANEALALAQRDALARQSLAAGKPAAALQWLTTSGPATPTTPPPPPPPEDVARAAITRVLALAAANAKAEERAAAVAAAHAAIDLAWPQDKARRTAARIEVAEAITEPQAAANAWRLAADGLDARAADLTRQWLQQRAAPKSKG